MTSQTYYRIDIFIPFLDIVVVEIEEKFIQYKYIWNRFTSFAVIRCRWLI